MSVPKILKSTDAHAPLVSITSFDDVKTILKAMLVDGIPELGGSLGWSEVFSTAQGWVIRDGNTGNTRDWIFRPFVDGSYKYVDVRGCDTASSATTGVNIFPSEAVHPVGGTTNKNSKPVMHIHNNSTGSSYTINNWAVIATEKFVYFITDCSSSYRADTIDDTSGWMMTTWGHFKAHGANVETAMVQGGGYSQYYSGLDYNMFQGTSTTVIPRFIQRTPDSDPGDGALEFMVDADRVAIRKSGKGAVTVGTWLDNRSGLPSLTSIDDPIITSTCWIYHNSVAMGSLPGLKYINANQLPPIAQGNISTLADGKNYAIFRVGGRSSVTYGAAILINLSDDWDL
ncbi:MAG: hypothetical protein JXR12_05780 [Neptunomonas phycophila]|uniref:hypothetical protein n=1 Tax=Neptunomonas phycophila TaxID=1572645 RepID=UPI003B8D0FCE